MKATANAKTAARERLESVAARLGEISTWLYENPELAHEEHRSSRLLADTLKEWGFEVEHPAYDLETAFTARAGSTGPEVVICAEYDALPGVGHACGHNLIAAAALGTAHALAPIAETLGFRVTVLGTPAEEKYGGKVDLIAAGAFAQASAAMMIHPAPSDVVDATMIAVAEIAVAYHGKTAHASAYPHLGINALDAFVQGYVNISTLRQHLLPTDKVHGIVTHGGDAPNIIPDHTHSSWYVRAQNRERLDELLAKVDACFAAGAVATGCTVEVTRVGHVYDDLAHNPTLVELFDANARALGRPMGRGADLPPSESGSTDMGNVSKVVPSIHPMIGISSHPAVNHQAEFAAHTVTPDGHKAVLDGALGMAWTVIDLAEQDLWTRL
jgi:amidohydrolase